MSVERSLERVRSVWTPRTEIEQLVGDLEPHTLLDATVRELLHRVVEQHGPFTVKVVELDQPVRMTGALRWELAGVLGYSEVSLWIDQEGGRR